MAVTRTVLPNTGLVQPQHGLTGYEADQDGNWALLDSLVPLSGQPVKDLGMNGVYSGFTLSTSANLIPGLTGGTLYAQGVRYAPGSVTIAAAPASLTSYLFYNSIGGFYYQASPVAATSGDALIGSVTTSGIAVTSVVQGTRVMGMLAVSPGGGGAFSVQHYLGRAPLGISILSTSSATFSLDATGGHTTGRDATYLYLNASGAGTALIQVW